MRLPNLYPTHYFYLAVAAMVLLHRFLPIASAVDGYWRLIALVPIVAGLVLNLDAVRRFRASTTTIKPFDHSTALVTSGAFQVTRNPIYLGMGLILAGIAIALGSPSPWLVVAAFVIAMDRMFIPFEEQMLGMRFGDDYKAYKQKVRRWV